MGALPWARCLARWRRLFILLYRTISHCLEDVSYVILLMVCEVRCTAMKNDDNTKKKYEPDASVWASFAIPGQIVAYIIGGGALGFLAGHFIDDALHTTPIATLIGLLLGLAAGVYGIYRLVSSLK